MTYCDIWSRDQAREMIPEVRSKELVEPTVLVDVDREGLRAFEDHSQDFAIANHVLEHVANPLRCLEELFRVVRPGGNVVVSVPDHRYTSDRGRAVTPLRHIVREYKHGVTEVTPLHFIDAVALTRPDVIAKGIDAIVAELLAFKARREHAHVWDSEAFRRLLLAAPGLIERPFEIVCEVEGDVTFFEYFAILQLG